MMAQVIAACLFLAAHTYEVPPAALMGIYQVEAGKVGQQVGPNKNGSYDLGPMQINTIWLPELSKKWGVNQDTAMRLVRDDACTNVGVAAWILRTHLDETQDIARAISNYHSRTPVYGKQYKSKVVRQMAQYNLFPMEHGK